VDTKSIKNINTEGWRLQQHWTSSSNVDLALGQGNDQDYTLVLYSMNMHCDCINTDCHVLFFVVNYNIKTLRHWEKLFCLYGAVKFIFSINIYHIFNELWRLHKNIVRGTITAILTNIDQHWQKTIKAQGGFFMDHSVHVCYWENQTSNKQWNLLICSICISIGS